ncbi:MAG: hypothetical protein AB1793_02160 [Candidatus Thermoplasmatota archaeon]
MKCGFCGAENPDGARNCSVCQMGMGYTAKSPQESFRRKPEFHPRSTRMVPDSRTMLPVGAGGILILNAVFALSGLMVGNVAVLDEHPELSEQLLVADLIFGGLAVLVLLAGALVIMRRAWGLGVVASIVSFFMALMFGLFCGITQAFVAVAAMVLLFLSRDEFRRQRA